MNAVSRSEAQNILAFLMASAMHEEETVVATTLLKQLWTHAAPIGSVGGGGLRDLPSRLCGHERNPQSPVVQRECAKWGAAHQGVFKNRRL